jgi:hypothetical protein
VKGCGRCWTDAELEADEYSLAWQRLAPRVVQLLENEPDSRLTQGLTWAQLPNWPEEERDALRTLLTQAIVRAAGDEQRRPNVDELVKAAAQLGQDPCQDLLC